MERRIDDHEKKLAREWFADGRTVYTLESHVSRSGMTTSVRCLIAGLPHDGEQIIDASWLVARIIGQQFDRRNGGVKSDVGGMEPGADIVHSLSYRMHGVRNGDDRAIDPLDDVQHGLTLRHARL